MNCVDVNVIVYAHRKDMPDHARYRAWLEGARRAPEPLGLLDVVMHGFVRIVTNPRVFARPTSIDNALDYVGHLLHSPNAVRLHGSDRGWSIFDRLCRTADAYGDRVPDATIAAAVIDAGATLITTDRGFSRYAGLSWRHPLDT